MPAGRPRAPVGLRSSPGFTSVKQLHELLRAAEARLEPSDLAALDEASAKG